MRERCRVRMVSPPKQWSRDLAPWWGRTGGFDTLVRGALPLRFKAVPATCLCRRFACSCVQGHAINMPGCMASVIAVHHTAGAGSACAQFWMCCWQLRQAAGGAWGMGHGSSLWHQPPSMHLEKCIF